MDGDHHHIDEINEVYKDLAKFLTRNFCKNFKLRRSLSGKRVVDQSSREVKNRLNLLFKTMQPGSKPNVQSSSGFSSNISSEKLIETKIKEAKPADQTGRALIRERFGSSGDNQERRWMKSSSDIMTSSQPPRSRTVSNSAVVGSLSSPSSSSPCKVNQSMVNERMSRSNTGLDDLSGSGRRVVDLGSCCLGSGVSLFDTTRQSSVSIDRLLFAGCGSSSCRSSTFDIDFSLGKLNLVFILILKKC